MKMYLSTYGYQNYYFLWHCRTTNNTDRHAPSCIMATARKTSQQQLAMDTVVAAPGGGIPAYQNPEQQQLGAEIPAYQPPGQHQLFPQQQQLQQQQQRRQQQYLQQFAQQAGGLQGQPGPAGQQAPTTPTPTSGGGGATAPSLFDVFFSDLLAQLVDSGDMQEKIPAEFMGLHTDIQRVEYLIQHSPVVRELKIKSRMAVKSHEKSTKYREEGNKLFQNEYTAQAILFYNKALSFAPHPTVEEYLNPEPENEKITQVGGVATYFYLSKYLY